MHSPVAAGRLPVNAIYSSATDPGRDQLRNDDFHCSEPTLGFFAVADGSGYEAGWVLSRTVVRALRQFVAETALELDGAWPCLHDPALSIVGNRLRAGLVVAGRSVEGMQGRGAGSPLSICALLWDETSAAVVAGRDCRIYVGRGGQSAEVRTDLVIPSWPQETSWPAGPVLADTAASVVELSWQAGDRWLLCSHGVHGALTAAQIGAALLDEQRPPELLASHVIELALARDGTRNTTAIVVSPTHGFSNGPSPRLAKQI